MPPSQKISSNKDFEDVEMTNYDPSTTATDYTQAGSENVYMEDDEEDEHRPQVQCAQQ